MGGRGTGGGDGGGGLCLSVWTDHSMLLTVRHTAGELSEPHCSLTVNASYVVSEMEKSEAFPF